jgi:hypothetical protein
MPFSASVFVEGLVESVEGFTSIVYSAPQSRQEGRIKEKEKTREPMANLTMKEPHAACHLPQSGESSNSHEVHNFRERPVMVPW